MQATAIKAAFVSLLTLAVTTAQAIPIVTFSFASATGSESSFGPDAQPAHASVSSMSRGTGVSASANAGTFSATAWTTSGSLDANDYFTFSLTPEAGYSMSLTQLILDERRSLTGIRNWVVRSSLDGFASDLGAFAVPDNDSTRTGNTVNLSAAFIGLTSLLEFRIYGFGAESSVGSWRVDNVKVEGTTQLVQRVPEGGSAGLLLLVVAVGMVIGANRVGLGFRRCSSESSTH